MANRVDIVLGFFSSRPNWDPPIPSPAAECVPHLVQGVQFACRRGLGGSQFRRGDRHCGTLGIYVLCGITPRAWNSIADEKAGNS
jgi:hypothetical protein